MNILSKKQYSAKEISLSKRLCKLRCIYILAVSVLMLNLHASHKFESRLRILSLSLFAGEGWPRISFGDRANMRRE